jgi:CHASE2 domain-containing sensor protein
MDTARLLWIVLFSSIGLGLFLYGKKQWKVVPLTCGLALMIYPYFVSGTALLVGAGVVLTAIPYFIRH